ncbi:MAG: bifunctional diaminohydroxyphosphoribosylaminopyrimidine deaminase/5-amino-6-(5-phosphoribosylamino)uracil reductase RibD [Arenicella sp.]|nr:bifunctional diaminohydroxyphosphoribosylaminopyrimidine deaminase/5-amino-6-(5-phosphoribosylamino)uracil reductase RibD [Arenicella sp.]
MIASDKKQQQSSKRAYMSRALELASRGIFSTHPNPRVGCVIVKQGEVVGEGYHVSAGGQHAEREALGNAGEAARGATVYLNMEPCCHQGRTPPCTDGLINAGVRKVVAAMADPNPLVSGGGFDQLKAAGIEVESGFMEAEARWLNRGFINRMQRRTPWVILKSAATLDGRTAAFDGQSQWITGSEARAEVQKLRAGCSAVVTGIGTVLTDDPQLNVRLPDCQRQPLRVVLDSSLQIPLQARVIGDDQRLIVITRSEDISKIAALTELGAEVIQQSATAAQLDLQMALTELGKRDCNEILIESGQKLSGAFMAAGMVDELVLFYAGSLLGDQGKSMFQFDSPLPFESRFTYRISDVCMVGKDLRVTAVNAESAALVSGVAGD